MIRVKYYGWLLPLLMCLLTACGEDEYHYPSVKQEYLTAFSGADGTLQSVLTDGGRTYSVVEDASKIQIEENATARIVSNYAELETADGTVGVKLYASLSAISSVPMTADEFKNGIWTDPANVQSIWMGLNYLNITLEVKMQKGKHSFAFIEDEVITEATTGVREVYLTLYHNSNNDTPAYTSRAYLSVPLAQYVAEDVQKVVVHFRLKTYSGEVKKYRFDYIPSLN